MRKHRDISCGKICSVIEPYPAAARKSALLKSRNPFQGLMPNFPLGRTISDLETNLKTGGEEADAASHLSHKNPFLLTQPSFYP